MQAGVLGLTLVFAGREVRTGFVTIPVSWSWRLWTAWAHELLDELMPLLPLFGLRTTTRPRTKQC